MQLHHALIALSEIQQQKLNQDHRDCHVTAYASLELDSLFKVPLTPESHESF